MSEGAGERSSFIEFARIARRRKWLIVACVVIAPLYAYWHAHRQPPVYSAVSEVLLTPENTALSYAGVNTSSSTIDPIRYAATQKFLARSPAVANRVAARAKLPGVDGRGILRLTSVNAETDANLLDFTATSHDPNVAMKLANLYAQAYTAYRRDRDTQGIESAISQLEESVTTTKGDPALKAQLLGQIQTLQTTVALQRQGTFVAQPATWVHQVSPHPRRDAILGLGLGLVLGFGLALLREVSDTRVRSTDEVAERTGLPLLGHLPLLDKRGRSERRLVMLEEPYGQAAELFRMLRTSIDLANLDRQGRALMVTSGTEGEGKTTVACNLAIAFAASGRRVILLDADLRRPTVHRFLGINGRPGLSDVAVGQASLAEALVEVALEDDQSGGSLLVLPSGPMPPNPGEFVGTGAVTEVLTELRNAADFLIVDTPPVLQVAEAVAISSQMDGLLLVVNLTSARKGHLAEVRRQLDRSPVAQLGFIAIAAGEGPIAHYEHYAPYAYPVDDLVS